MKNELLQHIRTTRINRSRSVMEEAVMVCGDGLDSARPSYSIAEGYQSDLLVRVEWFVVNGESNVFDAARENAAKQLLEHIYGPCVRRLNELRASLYAGDRVGCMKIIDEIEKYMTEVE